MLLFSKRSLFFSGCGLQCAGRGAGVYMASTTVLAPPGPAPDLAWTGEEDVEEEFEVGEFVFMLNPYFKDGTRLRLRPERESPFRDEYILNDARVEILDLRDAFALVCCEEGGINEGWCRKRNLTHVGRATGLAKSFKQPVPRAAKLQRSMTMAGAKAELPGKENVEGSSGAAEESGAGMGLKRLMATGRKVDENVAAQTAAIRRQLQRKRRGTLDPQSKFMARWDMTTSLALLFTATITPFEVCILTPLPLASMLVDPLSWFNRLFDCIFALDVFIQCITAYQEAPENGGGWVYHRRKIFRRYATLWMALDVLTTIPIDVVVAVYEDTTGSTASDAGGGSGDAGDGRGGTGTRALRMIRMLRLLKLARLLRGSRIIARWQSQFGISYAMVSLWQFLFLTAFTAHWMACLWVLIGRIDSFSADAPMPNSDHAFSASWIHKAGLSEASPAAVYGVSIYCAFSLIFGCGPGVSTPTNVLEYYVQMCVMIVGSFVWAYVASPGCVSTLTPTPSTAPAHPERP